MAGTIELSIGITKIFLMTFFKVHLFHDISLAQFSLSMNTINHIKIRRSFQVKGQTGLYFGKIFRANHPYTSIYQEPCLRERAKPESLHVGLMLVHRLQRRPSTNLI